MARFFITVPLLAALAAGPAVGGTTAFVGARVIPVDGPEIPVGTLLVEDGRIEAVGPSAEITLPGDAAVVDLSGRTIMPGLVDTHSHLGGFRAADDSGPIQPGTRIPS